MPTKKTTKDWEKEFDCEFEHAGINQGLYQELKSFISKARKQAVIEAVGKIKRSK